MRVSLALLAAAMALPLTACAQVSGDGSGQTAAQAQSRVTIRTTAGEHRFNVEVARTPEQQARGLMYRTSLPSDGGMLFPFPSPRIGSFWMKNTFIPLDIFFIRADGSIDRIAENTIPESLEPVTSGGEVSAVLELAGGTAARLGIDETATVDWPGRPR